MKFKLAKKHGCLNGKLEALSKGDNVLIEYLKFAEESVEKIEDIMQTCVKRENQELPVKQMEYSRDEFKKLQKDRRYKMKCISLIEDESGAIMAAELNFGNIEIFFETQDVEYSSDKVFIRNAQIMVYPCGDYSFKILDEEAE
ncbi:hypothetical protein WMO28_16950 [Blautia sp. CLA-JM-H16]|uniref:Uncharacterized protein n=1 Tax=Blautia aquisgranensis TaxID=3133153 RepID=A0ABV1BK17_9FIRM